MKLIRSIPEIRKWVAQAQRSHQPIAFVPTMGALHFGHINLIHRARKEVGSKGLVVVSIFVNPTQFNQKSDLKKYPRTLLSDSSMCRKAGADLIFAPSAKEMYPSDFSTWVEEVNLSLPLCGATRPGHFRGVCTVVLKLFNLVQPQFAIFGQKDAQQALVIKHMVRDLNIPVRIIVAAIVRETDGLAMSSRNRRLSKTERIHSLALSKALQKFRNEFRNGTSTVSVLKKRALNILKKVPGLKLDYLEIVDPATLRPVSKAHKKDLVAVAAFVGKIRLIDNIQL